MPVGNPPTTGTLNADITSAVQALEDANLRAREVAHKIAKLTATGDLAGIYPDPGDLSSAGDVGGWLSNLSGVYFGTDTQSANFNYYDALTPFKP